MWWAYLAVYQFLNLISLTVSGWGNIRSKTEAPQDQLAIFSSEKELYYSITILLSYVAHWGRYDITQLNRDWTTDRKDQAWPWPSRAAGTRPNCVHLCLNDTLSEFIYHWQNLRNYTFYEYRYKICAFYENRHKICVQNATFISIFVKSLNFVSIFVKRVNFVNFVNGRWTHYLLKNYQKHA